MEDRRGSRNSYLDLLKITKSRKFHNQYFPRLKVKLMITLLNLEAMHLVSPFSEQLLEYQASEFGDLMLDTCEVN